jgi:hypothetical protein
LEEYQSVWFQPKKGRTKEKKERKEKEKERFPKEKISGRKGGEGRKEGTTTKEKGKNENKKKKRTKRSWSNFPNTLFHQIFQLLEAFHEFSL